VVKSACLVSRLTFDLSKGEFRVRAGHRLTLIPLLLLSFWGRGEVSRAPVDSLPCLWDRAIGSVTAGNRHFPVVRDECETKRSSSAGGVPASRLYARGINEQ